MEARSRRVGGGFPGYNGPALPRAMRSSRGRGQTATRTSRGGGRSGFFELLATVAGQILQENNTGEEQELLNLGERRNLKLKCKELDSDQTCVTPQVPQVDQEHQGSSAALISSLESLGEAIRDDEARNLSSDKKNYEDLGADSVHSVVNKEVLHKQTIDDFSHSIPQADENPGSLIELATFTANAKVCDNDKQMTSSVSDNDENNAIKSDPESSTSTAIKHGEACVKMLVDNDDSMDSLQTPKAEEFGLCKRIEMETRTGKAIEILTARAVQDPMSSTVTDVTKAELSSEEVMHPPGVNDSKVEITDPDGTKKTAGKVSRDGNAKPWRSTEFNDEGDSGLEVDDKSQLDQKKLLILGKLGPKRAEADSSYLSELMLRSSRERASSKDIRMASPKRMLSNNLSRTLKDSTYAKGIRARKVIKLVKRSRVSSSRSKRKHAEMDTPADTDDEVLGKKAYYSGLSYTRQRTSRGFSIKRKKMTDVAQGLRPDLHVNTSNLMDFGFECAEGEPPAAAAKLRSAKAASVASSPTTRGCSAKISKKSGESHVKFTIKSFTVPELAVDLPESSTVSSLKRAVMDAAMNLLGGGLRVRVLLQGKKVPDEGATLAQVGISRAAKPDSLGFMLEPSPMPTSPTSTSEDPLLVLSRAAGQSSPRYPMFPSPVGQNGGDVSSRCPKSRSSKGNGGSGGVIDGENPLSAENADGKRVGVSLPVPQDDDTKVACAGAKTKNGATDRTSLPPHSTRIAAAGALAAIRAQADATRRVSKNESEPSASMPHSGPNHDSLMSGAGAIILHPGMNAGENVQGLALVPLRQKSHVMEVGKRRVRRPFTVVEVEALVHAVEKLGTGRWRDVKLRAFDQAKHRTYVDLKDKWKTLVHTARIAPHQRRGEPVPQELLERVTRAHTYWTAQAAKQQVELDY